MNYPKILTIQDVSCLGQCSLTVALPIISACGVETCVMPSAVLSTHTAGFSGYTFRDLSDDMPLIAAHWKKQNVSFDAVYTGYLGSIKQIETVLNISTQLLANSGKLIVDPAMADNGKLYPAFDQAYANEMKTLCKKADYLVPNVTEACFLTDTPYVEKYDRGYIALIAQKLMALGAKNVVLTGVTYREGKTGVEVFGESGSNYYEHDKIGKGCHGTGDVYASAFTGAIMKGADAFGAAVIAADFVVECIKATSGDETHWYGAKFELVLHKLIEKIRAIKQ